MRRSDASQRKDFGLPKPILNRPHFQLFHPFDPEHIQDPPPRDQPRNEDLLIRLQQYRIRHAVTAKPVLWQQHERLAARSGTAKLSAMLEYDRERVASVNLVALRRAIVVDEKKRNLGKRPFVPKYVEEAKLPSLFNP